MVSETWFGCDRLSSVYKYELSKSFPKEIVSAQWPADGDKVKKQLGDTAKLEGNNFYRKWIEDLQKHVVYN